MPSTCRCAGRGLEFCCCHEAAAAEKPAAQRIAELEQEVKRLKGAEALLLGALHDPEWRDKRIHPCRGQVYQNWLLKVYLPVPESARDKSPAAALRRALKTAAK